MYDDNVTVKVGVNWKEIVIKVVLLIIFILVLCWLFPKPDIDIFYDSVYTENINTMKNAAKSYYTTDKMPQAVGESTSMTLKEMVDNHMVIRFKDKNGDYCDESSSKVEVTKISDKEYALKVVLNCGKEKDYIIETIGCNSVCTGENCTVINNNYVTNNSNGSNSNSNTNTNDNSNNNSNNGSSSNNGNDVAKNDDVDRYEDGTVISGDKAGYGDKSYTVDVTYYQFRKAITNYSTVYSCPAGYVKNGNKCSRSTIGASIDATAVYKPDQQVTTDAKISTGETVIVYADPIKKDEGTKYSCPSGYTLNGSYCVKYTDATETIVTEYSCPSGYTKNGTKCTKTYDATASTGTGSYTCPNGGTLNDKKCTITQEATASTSYTCPSGYTKNGTSCYKVYDATYTGGATSYSCPSGYTLNGNKCYKTYDAKPTTGSSSYSCPSGYTLNGSKCYKTYDAKATTGATTYSCPNGGTLSGTKCTKSSSYGATWHNGTTTYGSWYTTSTFYSQSAGLATSCSSGTSCVEYLGSITGAACGSPCGNKGIWYKYARKSRSSSTSQGYYSCPNGGSLSGSTCYTSSSYNATATPGKTTYSCPNGGSLSGTKCTITQNATATPGKTTYSCPSGGTLSGTKCTITQNATSTPGQTTYSCPDGGTLSGTKCTITKDATATTGTGKYTCPNGGTLSGTKCTITTNATASTTYSCPSGFTLSGKTCTKTYDATYNPSGTSYSCPSGGTLSGTKCTITRDADKTETKKYTCPSGYSLNESTKKCEYKTNATAEHQYSYSCPTGYTQSGEGANTKCSKKVTNPGQYYCEDTSARLEGNKCIKTIKGEFSHFTCPADYTLSGSVCYKGGTEVIEATATTTSSVSYKYTWSKYSSLSGWEFTGKTKVVSERYNAGQQ